MTAGDLLDLFRQRAFDTVEPYLWPDPEVIGFIDEAQTDFVRMMGGLRDARNDDVTLISIVAGDEYVPLDKRVLTIVSARRLSDNKPVAVISPVHDAARAEPVPGPVFALVVGETEGEARLVNIAATAEDLRLVVRRLPLERIADLGDELEVRDEHAAWLLPGMMALAFAKPDTEVYNKKKADEYAADFALKADKAKQEDRRRAHAARTVAYGGL